MKGGESSLVIEDSISNKPIITCAGDWNLFCSLEAPLVAAIPQDSYEWRRSYGRPIKSVCLEATFVKFSQEQLVAENCWNILKRPIFHVYWTDCADVEFYKTTLREDIEAWLKHLQQKDINDWMIVLVETYDIRKTNKLLPRTTVLDKIKGDFATKQTEDRFLAVINPIKSESRSAESWRGLVSRMRHFILFAYNKTLIKFEEFMREQRDKRNEPDWDFSDYFVLQEQLAFVLEMLSLYEEALVQYDELDALFSQTLANCPLTDTTPTWLQPFKQPVRWWAAPCLTVIVPTQLRELIVQRKSTLLHFRTYLYQRQCAMLILANKPQEMAGRCLETVQRCGQEAALLQLGGGGGAGAGAVPCWAVLACTETLAAVDRLRAPPSPPSTPHHHAQLWHYAKDKLHEVGKVCGLLPGGSGPTSDQVHLALMLSAGLEPEGAAAGSDPTGPCAKLHKALSSPQCFHAYYLELAELAMGNYKHIGCHRFARLIGRELASWYVVTGEPGKACVFLGEARRSYRQQGWRELAAQTSLELAAAALAMQDYHKYTKLCAEIASTAELEILVRNFYFDEMQKAVKKYLSGESEPVLAEMADCFRLVSAELLPSERGVYITDGKVECRLQVESLLPREIVCARASLSVVRHGPGENGDKKPPSKPANKTDVVSNSVNSTPKKVADSAAVEDGPLLSSIRLDDLKPKKSYLQPLKIFSQLQYKEDRSLDRVTVECRTPKSQIKRSDSGGYKKPSNLQRCDFESCMKCDNFLIKPGINEIILERIEKTSGSFKLEQLSIVVEDKLEFLSNDLCDTRLGYEVVSQGVNVYLNKVDPKRELVAGLEHAMELVVISGSAPINEPSTIQLKSSPGLVMCLDSDASECMCRELTVTVPPCRAFHTTKYSLRLFAQLSQGSASASGGGGGGGGAKNNKDKSIEHSVWVACGWWERAIQVSVQFSPPLLADYKLLTSASSKFVQVSLKCPLQQHAAFALRDPRLAATDHDTGQAQLRDLNPKYDEDMVITSGGGCGATFLWEVVSGPLSVPAPLHATFTIQYRPLDQTQPFRWYSAPVVASDYCTMFVLRTRLEPAKGADFCRASQMAHLHLTIQRVGGENAQKSLMYEVLADQSMWAVCGRTAGVVSMESEETVSVSLEVMPLVSGHLPLPPLRISKYITTPDGAPRLEPFGPGQVWMAGRAQQLHVLPALPTHHHPQPPAQT